MGTPTATGHVATSAETVAQRPQIDAAMAESTQFASLSPEMMGFLQKMAAEKQKAKQGLPNEFDQYKSATDSLMNPMKLMMGMIGGQQAADAIPGPKKSMGDLILDGILHFVGDIFNSNKPDASVKTGSETRTKQ